MALRSISRYILIVVAYTYTVLILMSVYYICVMQGIYYHRQVMADTVTSIYKAVCTKSSCASHLILHLLRPTSSSSGSDKTTNGDKVRVATTSSALTRLLTQGGLSLVSLLIADLALHLEPPLDQFDLSVFLPASGASSAGRRSLGLDDIEAVALLYCHTVEILAKIGRFRIALRSSSAYHTNTLLTASSSSPVGSMPGMSYKELGAALDQRGCTIMLVSIYYLLSQCSRAVDSQDSDPDRKAALLDHLYGNIGKHLDAGSSQHIGQPSTMIYSHLAEQVLRTTSSDIAICGLYALKQVSQSLFSTSETDTQVAKAAWKLAASLYTDHSGSLFYSHLLSTCGRSYLLGVNDSYLAIQGDCLGFRHVDELVTLLSDVIVTNKEKTLSPFLSLIKQVNALFFPICTSTSQAAGKVRAFDSGIGCVWHLLTSWFSFASTTSRISGLSVLAYKILYMATLSEPGGRNGRVVSEQVALNETRSGSYGASEYIVKNGKKRLLLLTSPAASSHTSNDATRPPPSLAPSSSSHMYVAHPTASSSSSHSTSNRVQSDKDVVLSSSFATLTPSHADIHMHMLCALLPLTIALAEPSEPPAKSDDNYAHDEDTEDARSPYADYNKACALFIYTLQGLERDLRHHSTPRNGNSSNRNHAPAMIPLSVECLSIWLKACSTTITALELGLAHCVSWRTEDSTGSIREGQVDWRNIDHLAIPIEYALTSLQQLIRFLACNKEFISQANGMSHQVPKATASLLLRLEQTTELAMSRIQQLANAHSLDVKATSFIDHVPFQELLPSMSAFIREADTKTKPESNSAASAGGANGDLINGSSHKRTSFSQYSNGKHDSDHQNATSFATNGHCSLSSSSSSAHMSSSSAPNHTNGFTHVNGTSSSNGVESYNAPTTTTTALSKGSSGWGLYAYDDEDDDPGSDDADGNDEEEGEQRAEDGDDVEEENGHNSDEEDRDDRRGRHSYVADDDGDDDIFK